MLPLPQAYLSVNLTPAWVQLYAHSAPAGQRGGRELVLEARRTATLEGNVKRLGEGLDSLRRGLLGWGDRVE